MQGTANILRDTDPLHDAARFVCEALDFAPNGFAIVRLDGICVTVNRTLAGWIRPALPVEELGGVSVLAGDDGKLAAALRRAALGESVIVESSRVSLLAGRAGPFRLHVMPFRVGGRVQAASVAFEDRSEQALVVAAFEASERRFRLMVDCAHDGVAVHRNGILLYVNPAGVRILGYDSADEMVGRPVLDFVHPDSREEARKRLLELPDSPSREEVFLRKDGAPVVVEVSASRAPLDQNLPSFVFVRDASYREKVQEEQKRATRMETLGRLAGNLAHDFQNLLTRIQSSLELARLHVADPDALDTVLDRASAQARHAVETAEQLSTLGQRVEAEALAMEPSPRAAASPNVLICDDEERLAMLTADLLGQYGYRTKTATSVEETISALERSGCAFDALLLDVNLPHGSAGRVLERMRQIGCAAPVILTSGYSVEDIASELLGDPRVVHYLAKPYPVEELVDALSRVRPANSH